MAYSHFSRNGSILQIEQANISLENIAYQYGFGVYETIKVRNGIVYFIKQHIQRLLRSAEIIGLYHQWNQEMINRNIQLLLDLPDMGTCNLKILLIGAEAASGVQFFILPLSPLFPDKTVYKNGVKTITTRFERVFPNAKTLSMLPSYLAFRKAKIQLCYDALFLTHAGNILEGTRTNFFTVKKSCIFTPDKQYVLEGVTRQTVLSLAKKHGFSLREEHIPQNKLHEYDGAFLTSTSSKIVPISQIDDFKFPTISSKILELIGFYNSFLDESKGVFCETDSYV